MCAGLETPRVQALPGGARRALQGRFGEGGSCVCVGFGRFATAMRWRVSGVFSLLCGSFESLPPCRFPSFPTPRPHPRADVPKAIVIASCYVAHLFILYAPVIWVARENMSPCVRVLHRATEIAV